MHGQNTSKTHCRDQVLPFAGRQARPRRRHSAFWLVAVLLAVLVACDGETGAGGKGQESKKATTFKIAVVTWPGIGPLFLAQEKGIFAKNGVKVELSIIDDAAARRSALAAGHVQAIHATVDDFAVTAGSGIPGRVVMKADDSLGGDGIVASADIKKIEDLKGRTVAVPQGLPSHFFLLHALEKAGLKSSDLKVRHMEADQAGAAFIAGSVDAAVTWEPWLSKAKEKEGAQILLTTADAPGLVADVIAVHKDVLRDRRAEVEGLIRSWFQALEELKKNRAASEKVMAEKLKLSPKEFRAMVAGLKYSGQADNASYFGLDGGKGQFFDVFRSASRLWVREKLAAKEVDAKTAVDTAPLAAVLAAK